MDLTRFKLYRRLGRLLGAPLEAKSCLPENYFLLVDLVEGRLVLELMRTEGWGEELIEVFEPETPLWVIQERAWFDRIRRLN